GRSDEDWHRQREPKRDMNPSVSRERQDKGCETQERTQTQYPQQVFWFHDGISSFVFSKNNRRNHPFYFMLYGYLGGVQMAYEGYVCVCTSYRKLHLLSPRKSPWLKGERGG